MFKRTALALSRVNGSYLCYGRMHPNFFFRCKHLPKLQDLLNFDPQPEPTKNPLEETQPNAFPLTKRLGRIQIEEAKDAFVFQSLRTDILDELRTQQSRRIAIRKLEEETRQNITMPNKSEPKQDSKKTLKIECLCKSKERAMKNCGKEVKDAEIIRKCKQVANRQKRKRDALKKLSRELAMKEKCELMKLKKKCKELAKRPDSCDPCDIELRKKCKQLAIDEECKKKALAAKCKKQKRKTKKKKVDMEKKCKELALLRECRQMEEQQQREEEQRQKEACRNKAKEGCVEEDPCNPDPCKKRQITFAKGHPCYQEDPCAPPVDPCRKDPCKEREKMRKLCQKLAEIDLCQKMAKRDKMMKILKKCKKLAQREQCKRMANKPKPKC
ncbi:hypothetical protein KR067_006939 [Drosophila pandora]|nr:hypothetical protein KR067_006939 [Drosophila pandora]